MLCKISITAIVFSIFPLSVSIQAAPCPPPPPCPPASQVEGYLGNTGTTSGNCETLPLPPLCAFGSLSINQNPPLEPVNRLNPQQLPTTNNFQIFQNPCAISPTTWVGSSANPCDVTLSQGGGLLKMRMGPFLVGMSQTGPQMTVPQYNFNVNVALPNLSVDTRVTIFFGAVETNPPSGSPNYFNLSTNVVNSETCLVTYTPQNTGITGTIIDYNIMGNVFHDVYYNGLTPAVATSIPIYSDGVAGVYLSINGGPVTGYPFSMPLPSTPPVQSIQFFVPRSPSCLGFSSFILYPVNQADSGIIFTTMSGTGDYFAFTASAPFTGFLRLAALSTNDPVTPGTTWTQSTYFMPENFSDGSDTSGPASPACAGSPSPASTISPCPIENPTCALKPTSTSWWKTVEVDAIAPTGMNFYMLLPMTWANLFTPLAVNQIGATWTNSGNNPDSQALSDILPVIAMAANPAYSISPFASAYLAAQTYYGNLFSTFNGSCPPFPSTPSPCTSTPPCFPYTDGSDIATNLFLLQFDMIMANQLASNINTFQTTSRTLPTYVVAPIDNVTTYTFHRLEVPIQGEITTTATTMSWTYTLAPNLPATATEKFLVCFPFWKYLSGTTGILNNTVIPGQPLQPFIYNDTIKGTLYAAECNTSGVVTFLEGGIPSWYGVGAPPDLFIPSLFTITNPTDIANLNAALCIIQKLVIPLPYFPENFLDPGYNAGKICYMLAKSGLYIANFLSQTGQASQIVTITQPFIDNAKSCLTAYLLGRTPGSSFFVADRTSGGICVNGAGGDGTWANGPNLQQFVPNAATNTNLDSGYDFGNYIYNDHHFFAGYFLVACAMVTNWELLYGSGTLWVDLPVVGGDRQSVQQYKIRDMIDFLWRDTHNPFTSDPTQPIYDPDLPYNRYGLSWEGHGVANGLQYAPNSLGRNQESISEDFNCWLGINAYARLLLYANSIGRLTLPNPVVYQTLQDFSTMNLKMVGSAGVEWYKNTTFWQGVNMWITSPGFTGASIYIGQFSQATVTNGEVNDTSAQNQTFF